MNKLNIAILGASGYTGVELLRILHHHPDIHINALTADSQAGKEMREIYPHLGNAPLPPLVKHEQVNFETIDLVFCCLPHGTSQEIIASLPPHVKIIDLSADFRLHDVNAYSEWYGHGHRAPELQKQAVYGLTEWARDKIKTARLVANPGCYPTSALLPLIPLLQNNLIHSNAIIIDAKSGISGAGRATKQATLFCEVNEGASAYGIGHHRHMPEIEQGLSEAAGTPVTVRFTPHLVPMSRGMLSTIYVSLADNTTVEKLQRILLAAYKDEPFVQVLESGMPATHSVRGSNNCVIGVYKDRQPGKAILVSALDNLVKGASGQAVQNMNVMFGFEETTALTQLALFP